MSRRNMFNYARRLAGMGFGVLMPDLYGCGDSAGDFTDARWEIWKEDLAIADEWLRARGDMRVSLFGLGLGTLLAMEYANSSQRKFERIVLWRPVLNGRQSIMRLLLLGGAATASNGTEKRETLGELRKRLKAGQQVEIAGYRLAPELAMAIEQVNMAELGVKTACPLYWVEAVANSADPLPEAVRLLLERWRTRGSNIRSYAVSGGPLGYREPLFDEQDMLRVLQDVLCEQ